MPSEQRYGPIHRVFTPWRRRFTDEHALELKETKDLYFEVKRMHDNSRWGHRLNGRHPILAFSEEIFHDVEEDLQEINVVSSIMPEIEKLINNLIRREAVLDFPEIDWSTAVLSMQEGVDLRNFLRAKKHFHANEARAVANLKRTLFLIGCHIARMSPDVQEQYHPLFSGPLYAVMTAPENMVQDLIGLVGSEENVRDGLFTELNQDYYVKMCEYTGQTPWGEQKKPFPNLALLDLPPQEVFDSFMQYTPFEDVFRVSIPLDVKQDIFFSHMHVIGGSGAGKTQWLQQLFLYHLWAENRPSIVVVDSQGDMIDKISRLECFAPDGPFEDRLLLITPKEVEYPPAINVFDVGHDRFGKLSQAMREQVTAGVIDTFDYLFTGLLGADLTAKQGVLFRMVARLLISLPDSFGRAATVLDMIRLMDDPTSYMEAIKALPPIPREFFVRDFGAKNFAQTKEQIRYRLNALLENPSMARLFTAPKTQLDIAAALNSGKVILVDTAQDFLKSGSSHFGRVFISLVLQAILERAAIPEKGRHPTFMIIDEAAQYFDSNIDHILTEARKYKLGLTLAHQFLDQATHGLRASLAANTAIKMAAGISTGDARALAPDFRCTPDFILNQRPLHFATYIRGITKSAVSAQVNSGLLESKRRMTEKDYAEFRQINRENVGLPPEEMELPEEPEVETPRTAELSDFAKQRVQEHGFESDNVIDRNSKHATARKSSRAAHQPLTSRNPEETDDD